MSDGTGDGGGCDAGSSGGTANDLSAYGVPFDAAIALVPPPISDSINGMPVKLTSHEHVISTAEMEIRRSHLPQQS